MDNFGEITKNNIEREKASNPYKFISAEEALSFNDQDNLTDNGMNPNYNNNPNIIHNNIQSDFIKQPAEEQCGNRIRRHRAGVQKAERRIGERMYFRCVQRDQGEIRESECEEADRRHEQQK